LPNYQQCGHSMHGALPIRAKCARGSCNRGPRGQRPSPQSCSANRIIGRTDERVHALGGRRLIQALLLQQPGPGQLQRSGVCERHCLGIQRPLEGKVVANLRHAGHASETATGNTGFRGYVSPVLDHRPRQGPLPATRTWICDQMSDPENLGAIDLMCYVRCAMRQHTNPTQQT
jgi:hypothetical protein